MNILEYWGKPEPARLSCDQHVTSINNKTSALQVLSLYGHKIVCLDSVDYWSSLYGHRIVFDATMY